MCILQRIYNIAINHCSYGLCPQLHAVPARNLLLEHLIHHLMLLDHTQAVEPLALNLQRIHGATPAADILHLARHHVSMRNLSSALVTRLIP
jgi:hypothetical protein